MLGNSPDNHFGASTTCATMPSHVPSSTHTSRSLSSLKGMPAPPSGEALNAANENAPSRAASDPSGQSLCTPAPVTVTADIVRAVSSGIFDCAKSLLQQIDVLRKIGEPAIDRSQIEALEKMLNTMRESIRAIGASAAPDASSNESDLESETPPEGEPMQPRNVSPEEQRRYFEEIQKHCIDAAFEFYSQHKAHFQQLRDKRGKEICVTISKGPIESAASMNLPQWTHLLRRLCDGKHLDRDMVYQLDSFNGEIQPVDEVKHACAKKKVKSDRELLALVQVARNFCRQLKRWDHCADLDECYGVLEKHIRMAVEARKQVQRKQKNATWPCGGGP